MSLLTITTGPQEAIDYINGKFDKTVGHKHDGTDENGGQIDSQYIKNTPNGDITATNTQEAINQIASFSSSAKIHVPVRQTVLQGNVDVNGQANFLQIGTGLSINLLASTTPLILAFAYGFDTTYGQIDYVSSITTDQTAFWSSLPANQSFIQLYIDRNITTGVLTGGYTLKETAYGLAPLHFDTQHWYDYSNTTFMKVSDGNSWSNVQRIMVGECTTDVSSVTSVVGYAIQGKYDSEWFPVSLEQEIVKSCNIDGDFDIWGYIRFADGYKELKIGTMQYDDGYTYGSVLARYKNNIYLRAGTSRLNIISGINYPDEFFSGQARIFAKRVF